MALRQRLPGNFEENGTASRIVVIGVGNLLLRDEGVGVHVAREIQKRPLPAEVEVYDGGVAGLGLLDYFPGACKILLIDAVDMDLLPGDVVRFTPEEVRARGNDLRFSLHDIGLLEVLELARVLERHPPEVVIIGIQPKEISWGTELTSEVQASVPKAVEAVWGEIHRTCPGAVR